MRYIYIYTYSISDWWLSIWLAPIASNCQLSHHCSSHQAIIDIIRPYGGRKRAQDGCFFKRIEFEHARRMQHATTTTIVSMRAMRFDWPCSDRQQKHRSHETHGALKSSLLCSWCALIITTEKLVCIICFLTVRKVARRTPDASDCCSSRKIGRHIPTTTSTCTRERKKKVRIQFEEIRSVWPTCNGSLDFFFFYFNFTRCLFIFPWTKIFKSLCVNFLFLSCLVLSYCFDNCVVWLAKRRCAFFCCVVVHPLTFRDVETGVAWRCAGLMAGSRGSRRCCCRLHAHLYTAQCKYKWIEPIDIISSLYRWNHIQFHSIEHFSHRIFHNFLIEIEMETLESQLFYFKYLRREWFFRSP